MNAETNKCYFCGKELFQHEQRINPDLSSRGIEAVVCQDDTGWKYIEPGRAKQARGGEYE